MIGDILQPTHLLLILAVALIVLGPKRLPEVGKSLGRGLRDFRNAMSGDDHEPQRESLQEAGVTEPQPAATAAVQAAAPPQPAPQPEADAPAGAAPTEHTTAAQPAEEPQPVSTGAQSEPNDRST